MIRLIRNIQIKCCGNPEEGETISRGQDQGKLHGRGGVVVGF